MPATAVLPSKPGAAYAAVRLRGAGVADAERLAALYAQVRPGPLATAAGVRSWLAAGSALFVEDPDGRVLAALSWRAEPSGGDASANENGWDEGWRVEPIATLPTHRGRGFGRWLMTHLEASAIRGNVPFLALRIDDPELLTYYRRLGYRQVQEGSFELRKRVGGTWQTQETTR
ncbi:MAG: GNAT family N-acetyltransferase [Trueperaceae bacterium]